MCICKCVQKPFSNRNFASKLKASPKHVSKYFAARYPAWKKLQSDQQVMKGIQMKNLFAEDRERFNKYSIIFGDILFDFSKNLVNAETFSHLFDLAQECQLEEAIRAMFAGEKINHTENRLFCTPHCVIFQVNPFIRWQGCDAGSICRNWNI